MNKTIRVFFSITVSLLSVVNCGGVVQKNTTNAKPQYYYDVNEIPEREQSLETPPKTNENCPILKYLPDHLVYEQTPRILWWAPHFRILGEENLKNERAIEYAYMEKELVNIKPTYRLAINVSPDKEIYLGKIQLTLKPAPFRSYTLYDCENLPFVTIEEDVKENIFQYDFFRNSKKHKEEKEERDYTRWNIISLDTPDKSKLASIEIRTGPEGHEVYILDESGLVASFVRFNNRPPWQGLRWTYEIKRPNALDPLILLLLPPALDRDAQ